MTAVCQKYLAQPWLAFYKNVVIEQASVKQPSLGFIILLVYCAIKEKLTQNINYYQYKCTVSWSMFVFYFTDQGREYQPLNSCLHPLGNLKISLLTLKFGGDML